MHHDANTGQSWCTLSACHVAAASAEERNGSGTQCPYSARPSRCSLCARRPVSTGSRTRGRRRPRRSVSVPPPSTDACCRMSRRSRQDRRADASRSTNSSASWPSEGSREQNAGGRRAAAASRVFQARSLCAFATSALRATASGRSHDSSMPTVYRPRRVVVSGGRQRYGPFLAAQVRPRPLESALNAPDGDRADVALHVASISTREPCGRTTAGASLTIRKTPEPRGHRTQRSAVRVRRAPSHREVASNAGHLRVGCTVVEPTLLEVGNPGDLW